MPTLTLSSLAEVQTVLASLCQVLAHRARQGAVPEAQTAALGCLQAAAVLLASLGPQPPFTVELPCRP